MNKPDESKYLIHSKPGECRLCGKYHHGDERDLRQSRLNRDIFLDLIFRTHRPSKVDDEDYDTGCDPFYVLPWWSAFFKLQEKYGEKNVERVTRNSPVNFYSNICGTNDPAISDMCCFKSDCMDKERCEKIFGKCAGTCGACQCDHSCRKYENE